MVPIGIDDKYEVVKIFQETTTSAVILVKYRQLNELRILKTISLEDPRAEFILAEANLLSGFRSPEIPTIYDVGQINNANYLVEEFFDGQSLKDYLENQKEISLQTYLEILIEICEILDLLHSHENGPFIYKDLKPDHILITNEGIKLIDFGIAGHEGNREFRGYGTRGYASPEQLEGKCVDIRSDIYSLGRLMDVMLDFVDDKEQIKMHGIIEKTTRDSREARPNSVREIREILVDIKDNCHEKKQEVMHLQREIAVVSSEKNVGTTTIAIALVTFLNSKGIKSFYVDKSGGRILQKLKRAMPELKIKDGVLYHDNFYGLMEYGPAVETISPLSGWRIKDFGALNGKKPAGDLIFYICSGNPWQQDQIIPGWIGDKDVIVIMNHFTKATAKWYSKEIQKKIYAYPFNSIYFGSHVTNRLFESILKKEVNFEEIKR